MAEKKFTQMNLDPFFSLLKEGADDSQVNKVEGIYKAFKQKTQLFQQRVTPTELQKREIANDILDNNVNYVYNNDILPNLRKNSPRVHRHEVDDLSIEIEPNILLSPQKKFENHLKPGAFSTERPKQLSIKELIANSKIKRKESIVPSLITIHDDIENAPETNMRQYIPAGAQNLKPGQSTLNNFYPTVSNFLSRAYEHPNSTKPSTNRSPNRSPQKSPTNQKFFNHESIQEHLNNYRANITGQQLNGSTKIQSLKVTEYNKDVKPELTEQEKRDKLAKELRSNIEKKAAQQKNEKSLEEQKQEEIKKKAQEEAMKHQMQRIENIKKMKQAEKQRLESLINSANAMSFNLSFGNVSQAENKHRLNTDKLIKYLTAYPYYEEKLCLLDTKPVSNEFVDYVDYKTTFEPLAMNEYVCNVQSSLNTLIKEGGKSRTMKCAMRIYNKNMEDESNDEFTIVELRERKANENEEQIIGLSEQNTREIFDLSFVKNYLVLISSHPKVSLKDVNKDDFRNGFALVAYLSNQDKVSTVESPKALIQVNFQKLKKHFRKDWVECYVQPIEKITTFLREYISLNCLVYSDVNQYIYKPKAVSNIVDSENTALFENFFKTIKTKYNPGQLEAIKDVCLARNGICLLQGPPGTGKTHTLVGIVSGIYHYLKHSTSTHRRYIMICTPSNTALDEIIMRIKLHGLYDEDGNILRPNVVRVGVLDKNPNDIIKNCALENLAEFEMNKLKPKSPLKEQKTMVEIKDEIFKLTSQIDKMRRDPSHDKNLLNVLQDKRRHLYTLYQDGKLVRINEKETYNQIIQKILYEADIICCTLGSAGSDKLERFRDYIEAVIVDEASQCTEPSNIIPLQYSPKKLILIGDPRQLPATVFSSDCYQTKFNRSLFERILDCGVNPFFLYEQYRMVSNIRKFPSMYFYGDRLTDSKSVQERKFPPYLSTLENRNLLFIDTKFSKEISDDHSYYNKTEIDAAMIALDFLLKKLHSTGSQKNAIGCISPYKKQVIKLTEALKDKYGHKFREHVAVNTVDAFQGQEKDVIIFSAVRAHPNLKNVTDHSNLIGFLSDIRRLNVAITRPKFVLIVLGNSDTLSTNETWRNFIQHMASNNSYININQNFDMEKAIQIIFRGDVIPPYMTSYNYTPKKGTKAIDRMTPEEGEIVMPKMNHFKDNYYPKDSVSTKATNDDYSDRGGNYNKNNNQQNNRREPSIEETKYNIKRKLKKNDDIAAMFTDDSNDFEETLEKKIKKQDDSAKKIPVRRDARPPEVAKKEKEKYENTLSSLMAPVEKENSAKKSSAGKSALLSLFETKDEKPQKKEEDVGNDLLRRLLGGG